MLIFILKEVFILKKRLLFLLPLLFIFIFTMQSFASNKILAEEFFVFDDQKEIEFPNDNAAEIAENIKMIDPYYNEYEVIVNVLGKNNTKNPLKSQLFMV